MSTNLDPFRVGSKYLIKDRVWIVTQLSYLEEGWNPYETINRGTWLNHLDESIVELTPTCDDPTTDVPSANRWLSDERIQIDDSSFLVHHIEFGKETLRIVFRPLIEK